MQTYKELIMYLFYGLVLGRVFPIKPSSLTSHMVNFPHAWYPHIHNFFATLATAANVNFERFLLTLSLTLNPNPN
jgi:hypothetical protein